jgi:hypothetical protein
MNEATLAGIARVLEIQEQRVVQYGRTTPAPNAEIESLAYCLRQLIKELQNAPKHHTGL